MMEIIWSEETLKNYLKVIDYLFENWTIKEIERFENHFNKLIDNLKNYIAICPKSKILNLRKCIIDNRSFHFY